MKKGVHTYRTTRYANLVPQQAASSRTSNGKSLSDVQANGPKLQKDMFTILLRFRKHKIALTLDVMKMYRCIWIHPDDRALQRVIWRNEKGEISDYQLTTLTFGEKFAQYGAVKCFFMLAKEVPQHIADVLQNDFYVDDGATGAESLGMWSCTESVVGVFPNSNGPPQLKI